MVVAGCLLVGGLGADPAHAEPEAPDALAQVRAELSELERSSAAASERVNGARVELARSQERLALFSRQVVSSRIELTRHQRTLEQMARQLYLDAGTGNAVASFTLDDPDRFLVDLERLAAASSQQSTVVTRARDEALTLKYTSEALTREQQRLSEATATLGARQSEAEAQLTQIRELIGALEDQQRQRLEAQAAAEAERQRQAAEAARAAEAERQRLAAEAAAAERERQAAAAAEAARASTPSPSAPTGPDTSVRNVEPDPNVAPPSNREEAVARVIEFALSKVGGRYVWGGSGPDAYDCSGLTQAAWATAGVRLSHYSGSQYGEAAPVARDALEPGDLLFFYSIHQHVGVYLGDGKFVHAANVVDGIRLDTLDGYYQDNLVAAARPAASSTS